MLPSCGPTKRGTVSVPLSRAGSEEEDSFPRTGQQAQEAPSLTVTGCCGVGSAAEKLESQSQGFSPTRGFLRDTTLWSSLSLSGLGFVQLILLPALNIFVLNNLVKLHLAMAELST